MTAAIQRPKRLPQQTKILGGRKLNNIIEMYKKTVRALQHHRQGKGAGHPYKKDRTRLFVKTGENAVEEINKTGSRTSSSLNFKNRGASFHLSPNRRKHWLLNTINA